MFEKYIVKTINTRHVISSEFLALYSEDKRGSFEGARTLVGRLYQNLSDPEILISHLLIIPSVMAELKPVSGIHLIGSLIDFLFDELHWTKSISSQKFESIEAITQAIMSYQESIKYDEVLLKNEVMASFFAQIMLQISLYYLDLIGVSYFSEKIPGLEKEILDIFYQKIMTTVDLLVIFFDLNQPVLFQLSGMISNIASNFSRVKERMGFTKEAIPVQFDVLVQNLLKSPLVLQAHADHFQQVLSTATDYKDVENLLISFIMDKEKPLSFIFLEHDALIDKLIGLILKTPDIQKRLFQLSLVYDGLKSMEDLGRYQNVFILKIYSVRNDTHYDSAGSVDTIRQFLIKTFLDKGASTTHVGINYIPAMIMIKQDVDVAVAYYLANAASSSERKALYHSLMEGVDRDAGLEMAWWQFISEKKVPDNFYPGFSLIYSPVLKSTIGLYPERFAFACGALTRSLQSYDGIDPLLKGRRTVLELDSKIQIISIELARIFLSDFPFEKKLNLIKNVHESHLSLLLRLFTRFDTLAEVFESITFGIHKTEGRGKVRIQRTFHYNAYITQLSIAINKLKSDAFPQLSLKIENEYFIQIKTENLLLFILIVTREMTDVTQIPHQKAWIRLGFSLLEQLLLRGKGSFYASIMLELVERHDIHMCLPVSHRSDFLKAIRIGQSEWSLSDEKIQSLEKFFSSPAKRQKRRIKSHPLSSLSAEAAELEVSSEALRSVASVPSDSLISDTQLLVSTWEASSKPQHASDIDSVLTLSDEASLHDSEDFSGRDDSEPEAIPPSLLSQPALTKTPLELFYKRLQSALNKINREILRMERVQLPDVWAQQIKLVSDSVGQLMDFVSSKFSPVPAINLIAQEEIKFERYVLVYAQLDIEAQWLLEKNWNKALAYFCWMLQCEINKSLHSFHEPHDIAEFASMHERLSAEILVLSHSYYKNIKLHCSDHHVVIVNLLTDYFEQMGYTLWLKGNFVFPEKARDLDLFLTPNDRFEVQDFNLMLSKMPLPPQGRFVLLSIYQNHEVFSQQVQWLDAGGRTLVELDFIFSLKQLSQEDLLNKTSNSIFSTPSVFWKGNGLACMLPLAARSNCTEKLVFCPIVTMQRDEDWIPWVGYLVKQLIKLDRLVCYTPELHRIIDSYFEPKTRYASNSSAPLESIERNKKIVVAALGYLFNRFCVRTHQTIEYILDKQLLRVLFPFRDETYQLCFQYYSDHFADPARQPLKQEVASPVFLAMFFLGGMIDSSETERAAIFKILQQGISGMVNSSLAAMIMSTMNILHKLPQTTIDFYIYQCGPGLSFEDKAVESILKLWHRRTKMESAPVKERVATGLLNIPVKSFVPGRFFQPVINADRIRKAQQCFDPDSFATLDFQ